MAKANNRKAAVLLEEVGLAQTCELAAQLTVLEWKGVIVRAEVPGASKRLRGGQTRAR